MAMETMRQTSEQYAEIQTQIGELASNVREYTAAQVDTWQQLPFLALQAEGKSGYSRGYQKLYEYGLLEINGGSIGLFGTYIDCENGNILQLGGAVDLSSLARDEHIVEAWLPDGQAFDGERVLRQYQQSAMKPHSQFSRGETDRDVQEWRHQTARRLGLLTMYKRLTIASEEQVG